MFNQYFFCKVNDLSIFLDYWLFTAIVVYSLIHKGLLLKLALDNDIYIKKVWVFNYHILKRVIHFTFILSFLGFIINNFISNQIFPSLTYLKLIPSTSADFFFMSLIFLISTVLYTSISEETNRFYDSGQNKNKFIFNLVINSSISLLIISILYCFISTLRYLENQFCIHEMYLMDWTNQIKIKNVDLSKGVFFSLIISFYFTIIQFRFLFESHGFIRSFLRTILFSIITAVGLSTLFYAIFNTLFNYMNYNSIQEVVIYEINNNLFILRLNSIILFYKFYRYFKTTIYKNKISIMNVLFPNYYLKPGYVTVMDYSASYFSQISIYIIVLFYIWLFTIEDHQAISIKLLNWGLFYIIEDWQIIYKYTTKFKKVLGFDFQKLNFFNILFLLILLVSLYSFEKYFHMLVVSFLWFYLMQIKVLADKQINRIGS